PVPVFTVAVCSPGVNGNPVCDCRIPLICQPPSTAPAKPCRPKPGSWYVKLAVNRCRISNAELPRSQNRQRGSCGVPEPPPKSVATSSIECASVYPTSPVSPPDSLF